VEAVAAGGKNLFQLLQNISTLGTVDKELTSTPSALFMKREAEQEGTG